MNADTIRATLAAFSDAHGLHSTASSFRELLLMRALKEPDPVRRAALERVANLVEVGMNELLDVAARCQNCGAFYDEVSSLCCGPVLTAGIWKEVFALRQRRTS